MSNTDHRLRDFGYFWELEGAVIVGSILLAFGIQAWWDETQERQGEAR